MSDARRKRTLSREKARQAAGLLRDREKLFLLEPGGSPVRPLEVHTASVVESRAETLRCPRCEGRLKATDHEAVTVDQVRLRRVGVYCQGCGSGRDVWLRVCSALN
jgi:uncharacterized protein with PIN domain